MTRRPRGIYGTSNVTTGAYRPNPGQTGVDTFDVKFRYERTGGQFTTDLHFTAEIVE